MWNNIVYFLLFWVLFFYNAKAQEIDLTADIIEYDDANKVIFSSGNVTLKYRQISLTAEKVVIDISKQYIVAEGSVCFYDGINHFSCEKAYYDTVYETATVLVTQGSFSEYYFTCKELIQQKEVYHSRETSFTTCNLQRPHYRIFVKSAKIEPQKKLQAKGVKLYLSNIPVLYLPYWYQSLKERRDCFEIFPGYADKYGITMQIRYSFPVGLYTYGKIYFDYFQKQDSGKGFEYNYYKNNLNGTLYTYYVTENNIPRWTVKYHHRQQINTTWTLQGNTYFQSDDSFNNYYFAENWFRRVSKINSDIAVTKIFKTGFLRLSIAKGDLYDTAEKKFSTEQIILPKVEFMLIPQQVLYNTYLAVDANIRNEFSKSTDTYIIGSTCNVSLQKRFLFINRFSVIPKVGYIQSWQDKTSKTNTESITISRYYLNLNSRLCIFPLVNLDLIYLLQNRCQKNQFQQDYNAIDYGNEINQIKLSLFGESRSIYASLSAGYDFRLLRNEVVRTWEQKMYPVSTLIQLKLTPSIKLHLVHIQKTYPFELVSIQTELSVAERMGFSMSHNSAYAGELSLSPYLNFLFGNVWKIYLAGICNISQQGKQFILKENEISLYRDLHCWEAKLTYRQRTNIQECFISIGLKTTGITKAKLYRLDQEKLFYPWR